MGLQAGKETGQPFAGAAPFSFLLPVRLTISMHAPTVRSCLGRPRSFVSVFSAANGHGGSQSSLCLASSVRWFVTFLPIEGISQRQESEDDEQSVSRFAKAVSMLDDLCRSVFEVHMCAITMRHVSKASIKSPSLHAATCFFALGKRRADYLMPPATASLFICCSAASMQRFSRSRPTDAAATRVPARKKRAVKSCSVRLPWIWTSSQSAA